MSPLALMLTAAPLISLDGGAFVKNPRGPDTGTFKVTRGGSWWCSRAACAGYGLFARGKTRPDAAYNNVGFRCARGP